MVEIGQPFRTSGSTIMSGAPEAERVFNMSWEDQLHGYCAEKLYIVYVCFGNLLRFRSERCAGLTSEKESAFDPLFWQVIRGSVLKDGDITWYKTACTEGCRRVRGSLFLRKLMTRPDMSFRSMSWVLYNHSLFVANEQRRTKTRCVRARRSTC